MDSIPDSLTSRIMALLQPPTGRPLNKNELARELDLPPEERGGLRHTLQEMVESGSLTTGRGERFHPRDAAQKLLTGVIVSRARGPSMFRPDPRDVTNIAVLQSIGADADLRLSIPADHTGTAFHGDRVSVKLIAARSTGRERQFRKKPDRRRPEESAGEPVQKWEGRVVKVLSRKNTQIPGTLVIREKHAWVTPDDILLPRVEVQLSGETQAQAGDKVVVLIEEWPERGGSLKGRLLQRLGRPGEKGVDVLGVIFKFRLPLEFPPAVLAEADAIPLEIPESEIATREDWRERHIITIDPFDAKDFDDAIGVTALPDGGWELAVHIADVAHYVRPGSALDREAIERGNSTYLVDRVLPMLPERLSNGLCSLRPNEDKLTRFAVMKFDAKGRRVASRFGSAVIRSRRRYTYEEAMASLKEPTPGDPDSDLLQLAWGLASKLRESRFKNGALDLEFPEIKLILDDQGVPVRMTQIYYDESHQLIEEFMLSANCAVAEKLLQSGRPGIYRIHEDPDDSKLQELRGVLAAHGIITADLTVRTELQQAIAAMSGRPEEPLLKLSLLKSLKRAVYSPDSLGHYGLAFEHYTHFTSPIRRYADLIVHRCLWNLVHPPGAAAAMRTPNSAEMAETAEHISTTERTSAEAEMESRRMKQLEYFERLANDPGTPAMPCIITRVLPFGLFIETTDTQIRGAIRLEDLGWNSPYYDSASESLRNRSPQRSFKAGELLYALPVNIDRERSTVNFRLVESKDVVNGEPASRPVAPVRERRDSRHSPRPPAAERHREFTPKKRAGEPRIAAEAPPRREKSGRHSVAAPPSHIASPPVVKPEFPRPPRPSQQPPEHEPRKSRYAQPRGGATPQESRYARSRYEQPHEEDPSLSRHPARKQAKRSRYEQPPQEPGQRQEPPPQRREFRESQDPPRQDRRRDERPPPPHRRRDEGRPAPHPQDRHRQPERPAPRQEQRPAPQERHRRPEQPPRPPAPARPTHQEYIPKHQPPPPREKPVQPKHQTPREHPAPREHVRPTPPPRQTPARQERRPDPRRPHPPAPVKPVAPPVPVPAEAKAPRAPAPVVKKAVSEKPVAKKAPVKKKAAPASAAPVTKKTPAAPASARQTKAVKTAAKAPVKAATKTAVKAPVKAAAPVKKVAVKAAAPVKKVAVKAAAPAKKAVTRVTAKTAAPAKAAVRASAKTTAAATVPAKKSAVKAPAKTAVKPPVKAAAKQPAKSVTKAPVKAPSKKSAAKKTPPGPRSRK